MIKAEQAFKVRTGTPEKYPQKKFKPKQCRKCGDTFNPQAPSQHYCGEACAAHGHRDAYYRRNYGIGVDEWTALYERQGGVCYVCENVGFTMQSTHVAKLMVDHCHTTGAVRGLLCHNCNRALGLLKDSKRALTRALEYLEGATTIPKGSTPKWVEAHGPVKGEDIVCSVR